MNIRRLLGIIGVIVVLGLGGCILADYDRPGSDGGYGYNNSWYYDTYPYYGHDIYHIYPRYYGYYGYYGLHPDRSYPAIRGRHHHNDGDHDRDDRWGGPRYSRPPGLRCHGPRC